MFGIQLCDNLPRDIRNRFATGNCSRNVNLDWIHAGNMMNDKADRTTIKGALKVWLKNKMFKEVNGWDQKKRRRCPMIEVGIWA